ELATGFMSKITGTGSIDFKSISYTLLWLIGLYLVSLLCNFVQSLVLAGVSQKITYTIRKEISDKIDRLPYSYFDTRSHGEVLSRFSNDVDLIQQSMSTALAQLLQAAVQLIGYLVMMLSISWKMTIVALIVIPLSMILMVTVVKRS